MFSFTNYSSNFYFAPFAALAAWSFAAGRDVRHLRPGSARCRAKIYAIFGEDGAHLFLSVENPFLPIRILTFRRTVLPAAHRHG